MTTLRGHIGWLGKSPVETKVYSMTETLRQRLLRLRGGKCSRVYCRNKATDVVGVFIVCERHRGG